MRGSLTGDVHRGLAGIIQEINQNSRFRMRIDQGHIAERPFVDDKWSLRVDRSSRNKVYFSSELGNCPQIVNQCGFYSATSIRASRLNSYGESVLEAGTVNQDLMPSHALVLSDYFFHFVRDQINGFYPLHVAGPTDDPLQAG